MNDFSQKMINSLDLTTEHGFAEALLIAIASLKNKDGLLVNVKLGEDIGEHMGYVEQIARMMLNKGDNK